MFIAQLLLFIYFDVERKREQSIAFVTHYQPRRPALKILDFISAPRDLSYTWRD